MRQNRSVRYAQLRAATLSQKKLLKLRDKIARNDRRCDIGLNQSASGTRYVMPISSLIGQLHYHTVTWVMACGVCG